MLVTWQTVITAAAVLAAVAAIFKTYNRGYDMVKHQKDQDKNIKDILEELELVTYALQACLKGVQELGADGPVTEAIGKIQDHINKKAHGG